MMNKQQELYNELRQIRNQHFPPVLEFGCECVMPNSKERYILCKEYEYACETPYWHTVFITEPETLSKQNIDTKTVSDSKILGKEVSLQEVIMMENQSYNNEFSLEGSLLFLNEDTAIDLSKPIKDQDYETLEQILQLIKT